MDEDLDLTKSEKNFFMNLKTKVSLFFRNRKKRTIFIITVAIIVAACLFAYGYTSWFGRSNNEEKKEEEVKAEEEQASLFQSPLDGLMVEDESVTKRHPLAIIVENHVQARPQAGLSNASIVYEAIAEGGITRFLAIFGTHESEKVGPVRSARTFFIDWLSGYNAYFGHVGGSINALDRIKSEGVYDLDQFANSAAFWREYSSGIATEHTMYTSTAKLRQQAEKKGYPSAINFNQFRFKDDQTTEEITASANKAEGVTINFSTPSFLVDFKYDTATNSYLRFLAGQPHIDKITKKQINPKNVIVMTVNRTAIKTRINESVFDMQTIGSGQAKIFKDGQVIDGTWRKTSVKDRELFYDQNGQEIEFNRGSFWISVVPPETKVTVK